MRKRGMCALMAICLVLALCGCSQRREEERPPAPTLGRAEARYAAPDGDGTLREGGEYQLYLQSVTEPALIARTVTLEAAGLNDTAEALVRELIGYEGDAEVRKAGATRALDLYGDHPVEISGGVCTVNLASSALQLSLSNYYRFCLSLATTLCELSEISAVNVLVAGQSVGLDITGNLPMGTLAAHPGENLSVLWEQMDAKKTPLGEDISRTALNALATLYYPLPGSRGIACVTRSLSFEGQTPRQLTAELIDAITDIRRSLRGGADFPDLKGLMLHEPVISELEEGGRLITLSLREDAEERLQAGETNLACLVAAVTCTLTTFIPGIAAVCVRVGEKPVTDLRTGEGEITALGGLVRRETLDPFLMQLIPVYYARNGILCECDHPVERKLADSPRAQLRALMEGPDAGEMEEGVAPVLPEGVREDDILGISAQGDTLLVNLSENFRQKLAALSEEAEALACYSMVNTLCRNTGLRRVRFYFEGEQAEQLAGGLYWAGEFLYNPGLAEKGLG